MPVITVSFSRSTPVCVVRRVKVRAEDVSTDPRARRRTIPQGQFALALDGLVDQVYAYSFIATNLAMHVALQ